LQGGAADVKPMRCTLLAKKLVSLLRATMVKLAQC